MIRLIVRVSHEIQGNRSEYCKIPFWGCLVKQSMRMNPEQAVTEPLHRCCYLMRVGFGILGVLKSPPDNLQWFTNCNTATTNQLLTETTPHLLVISCDLAERWRRPSGRRHTMAGFPNACWHRSPTTVSASCQEESMTVRASTSIMFTSRFEHPHPAGLAGAVSWILERRGDVLKSARLSRKYALLTSRASRIPQPDSPALALKLTSGRDILYRCQPGRSGREYSKVAGMGSGRQKDTAGVTRELPNPDTIDNRNISPEIFMETQVKWSNLCPAK